MKREISPTVYLLASRKNGTLYVGVTSDLTKRLYEHRNGLIEGFTSDYGVKRLVGSNRMTRWRAQSYVKSGSRNGTGNGKSS